MCMETIGIQRDEESNAGTHFSQPFPIRYNPILAHKHKTPAVRSASICYPHSRTLVPVFMRWI